MFKEFKEFAFKGNVLDLAVAVVLGAAFGAIVKSFVDDLINPFVGLLLGGTDLSNLFVVLRGGGPFDSLVQARAAGAAVWAYGSFLNSVITFLLVGFSLFLAIKAINAFRRAEESTTRECPQCTTEISKAASRCPACTSEVKQIA
ncbi:MAG TPA: large conductance mechanosensitive channel protein MscL [Coriobacteriia bacterium]|nr:large conductance mechanosensitive channel protein MscL [Coriobacteriia bacterium]